MVDDRIAQLTNVQKQCLRLAGQGLSSKEIAPLVSLTHRTVDQYLYQARQTLGAQSRGEAAKILRESENSGPLKKLQLKPEAVAEPQESSIMDVPANEATMPQRWLAMPQKGGSINALTATQRLIAIGKIAVLLMIYATAIIVLAKGAFIVLSNNAHP